MLFISMCAGCQGVRLVKEGEDSRNAILDLYTVQAMDNLVRARRNMPFVQLAYRNIGVQDQDSLGGTIGETYTDSNVVTRTGLAVVSSAVHTASSVLAVGGSKSRAKTITYAADPVTDKNDIYVDYLAFANDQGLLMESCSEPKCGYHIRRKFNGKWYWIPAEAAPVFLALVLKTSMMRGPDALPSPYYDRKIAKAHSVTRTPLDPKQTYLQLDQSVPASDGYVAFTRNKRRYQLDMLHFVNDQKSDDGKTTIVAVEQGKPTNFIRVTIPNDAKYTAEDLVGLPIQVFSTNYPPEVPGPSPEMQRLQDSVNNLDINLKNLATPK